VSGTSAVGSARLGVVGARVVGLAVAVASCLSLMGGDAAWATTGHAPAGQFGGRGGDDGQFGEPLGNGPVGLAVMPSTGDVFTVDGGVGATTSAPRAQRFNAAGAFQSGFSIMSPYNGSSTIAVDGAGAGAIYVSVNNNSVDPVHSAVAKYDTAGGLIYELNDSTSGTTLNNPIVGPAPLVAVDPADGTVYALATDNVTGGQVVDSFDQTTGTFLTSFDGSNGSPGAFQCPSGLAVDGLHRVYVLDGCSNRVDQYSATGVWGATVYDGSVPAPDGSSRAPSAVAVDPISGEVYVAAAGLLGLQITHFTAGGTTPIYTFDAFDVGGARAMAVSGTGTVYVSDATDAFVARFVRFDGPTLTTEPATAVNARDATLNGTINPGNVASSYYFEYGTGLAYGKRTPVVGGTAAGSGNVPVAASASVDGLQPNKTYHYRIVGFNASGSIVGQDETLTTAVAPPTPDGSSPLGGLPAFASAVTPRSATLHGTVNANNSSAGWHFEYGTTTAYGSTPFGGFLSDGDDQPVASALTGLEPDTLYHFRVVTGSGFLLDDPQYGADQTFFTSPAAGGGARHVSTRRATLTATINPHGSATTYHFNYGPTASYGASTPEVDGGHGDGGQMVTQDVSGLSPDTTYHVQVVATTAGGVVRSGADGLFRTSAAPTATAIGPTGVSTEAATLAGEVNTRGLTGSYHFDVWSLDGSYVSATGERPVSGSPSAERVTAALTGLPAGETFVVQLTVTSNDSVGVSDLLTFATASVPKVFPTPLPNESVYGCGSPRLDPYNAKPKPGDTIAITGKDLGPGGSAVLADRPLKPTDWSATGFKLSVPDDAAGTLTLTIDCGHRSNTIAVAIFQKPESAFSITGRSVTGSTATLKVKLPGPGKLVSSGASSNAVTATIKKAGTAALKVKLSNGGRRALARAVSHTLKVSVRLRFTPAGGQSVSKTVTLTFKRGGGR
jgi:hypothetical protein